MAQVKAFKSNGDPLGIYTFKVNILKYQKVEKVRQISRSLLFYFCELIGSVTSSSGIY